MAARHAGVHPSTHYRWMERGELEGTAAEDDPYRHYRAEVERALADAEAAEVALIAQAARGGDWRAATWLLERRFGPRWGRRDWGERPQQVSDHTEPERQAPELTTEEFDREVEELIAVMRVNAGLDPDGGHTGQSTGLS